MFYKASMSYHCVCFCPGDCDQIKQLGMTTPLDREDPAENAKANCAEVCTRGYCDGMGMGFCDPVVTNERPSADGEDLVFDCGCKFPGDST